MKEAPGWSAYCCRYSWRTVQTKSNNETSVIITVVAWWSLYYYYSYHSNYQYYWFCIQMNYVTWLTVSRSLVDEYICPAGDTQPRSVRTAGIPSALYPTAIISLTLIHKHMPIKINEILATDYLVGCLHVRIQTCWCTRIQSESCLRVPG